MSQNSIDYPGEQVNPQNGKKPWIVHQPAYVGKNYFMVNYAERTVIVHAADKTAPCFSRPSTGDIAFADRSITRRQAWTSSDTSRNSQEVGYGLRANSN